MTKSTLVALIFVALLTGICGAQEKLGFVDIDKVVSSSILGKEVQAEITKSGSEAKATLSVMEKEIKALQSRLDQSKGTASSEEISKIVGQIDREKSDYERARHTLVKEQRDREKALYPPLQAQIDKTLQKVATDLGYSVVLSKGARDVLYISPQAKITDLTDEVVKQLDSAVKE